MPPPVAVPPMVRVTVVGFTTVPLTINVGILPPVFSGLDALDEEKVTVAAPSSLVIVPIAVAVPIVVLAPGLGFVRVTVKDSVGSKVVSPLTLMVMEDVVAPTP